MQTAWSITQHCLHCLGNGQICSWQIQDGIRKRTEVCLLSMNSKMPLAGIDRTKELSACSQRECLRVGWCSLASRLWQVASYHWHMDKCLPLLHNFSLTSLLTHCCFLKSSKMSGIPIHKHEYMGKMLCHTDWFGVHVGNFCCRFDTDWFCSSASLGRFTQNMMQVRSSLQLHVFECSVMCKMLQKIRNVNTMFKNLMFLLIKDTCFHRVTNKNSLKIQHLIKRLHSLSTINMNVEDECSLPIIQNHKCHTWGLYTFGKLVIDRWRNWKRIIW